MKKAVITVIGEDKVGIIHKVSGILCEGGVNILDISQTIMQELFTMVMLVDVKHATIPFEELKSRLEQTGEQLGVKIVICHEDIFHSMHRI